MRKGLLVHVIVLALLFWLAGSAGAQTSRDDHPLPNCPMPMPQRRDNQHAAVEKRGARAMGFSLEGTTHHFRLVQNGGTIEVTANDAKDRINTHAIRSHLSHIGLMFANGDFSTPMVVHAELPPGATTMKLLKEKISYQYEESQRVVG